MEIPKEDITRVAGEEEEDVGCTKSAEKTGKVSRENPKENVTRVAAQVKKEEDAI